MSEMKLREALHAFTQLCIGFTKFRFQVEQIKLLVILACMYVLYNRLKTI